MKLRSIEAWNFAAMPSTFGSILRYVRDAPLFHAGMWLVTAFGLMALPSLRRTSDEARRLAVITAIVWLGYNAFLLVIYLAVFTEMEALWAADYWRYTPHVALLALSVPVLALARVPSRMPGGSVAVAVTAVALAAIVLVAPLLRRDFGTTRAKQWPLLCGVSRRT